MATTTVKSTYSLDEETVRTLERLARRLGTSKSEVLRRAIRELARSQPPASEGPVAALDELQRRLRLTPDQAAAWEADVRTERLASGTR